MKTLFHILIGITLTAFSLPSVSNELINGGFELNPPTNYGNNIGHSVAPWGFTGSTTSNVVHVDGPGGNTSYGSLGPASDATNAGPGIWRNYLDATDASGKTYQSFTTSDECSGEVRFGGFFSTRGNVGGNASVEILTGNGLGGSLVGVTSNVSIAGGNSETTPWTPVNFVTTLSASTTYTLVINMDNQLNFDEGYVNFVDGPCKDDSDLNDLEPKQCLVLEPKVECVGNNWQVSITNSSSSFNADVLDITSLTPGVTISGNSPNWILNGALPNSSVDISVDGTVTGGGNAKFADLCCTTELHLDIPDEVCEVIDEVPHIYTRKSIFENEEGNDEFHFILDSLVQLNAPTILTITDTIPIGITLTSLDSSNTSNWSCPGLPMTGPTTLVCTYIGIMPIPAGVTFDVILHADIELSEDVRENCIETNLTDTDTASIPYDGNKRSCVDIPPEEVVEKPSITLTKGLHQGRENGFVFRLTATSTSPIALPNIVQLTDTLPVGVTLTAVTPSASSDWNCPGLPITGPATLTCQYIGPMPFVGNKVLDLYTSIEPSNSLRQNCSGAQVLSMAGKKPNAIDSLPEHCVDIPPENECEGGLVLIDGECVTPQCTTDADCPVACINGTCGGAVTPSFEEFNFLKVCETSPDPVHVPFTCKITVQGLGLDGSGTISVSDVLSNQGGGVITQLITNDNWNCDSLPSNAASTDSFDCTLSESDLVASGNEAEFTISGHFNMPYSGAQNCISNSINDGEVWPYMSGHCWKADEDEQCDNDDDCLQTESCKVHPTLSGTNVCQPNIIPEETGIITIDKSSPNTCRAGEKCEFTFDVTNKSNETFKGFAGITDIPKKRFGKIRGKSKDWICEKKGKEYRCGIEELTLKPSETEKVTLTLQVPRNLVGQVGNCATIETEESVSKESCTTVEIVNDKKCGYDDKLVNGRCVPRCTNKRSNWNGVDCMICSSSRVWNDRYKRCDKKPQEPVVIGCPNGYQWSTAQRSCIRIKVNQPDCGAEQRWDNRVRKCVSTLPPKCNKGTKWDVNQKRCVEIKVDKPSCGKDQRWDNRVRKCVSTLPPKCNKGTKWDINQKRCVEIKVRPPVCKGEQRWDATKRQCVSISISIPTPSTDCKNGTKYNVKTKHCEKVEKKKCNYGYEYNEATKKCENVCGVTERLVAGKCIGIRDVINIYNIFKGRGGDGGGTPTPDLPH